MASFVAPPIGTSDFTMTARLDLPAGEVTGPLFSYGGQMGGIGFYLKQGKPTLILNSLKGDTASVETAVPLKPGVSRIALDLRRTPGADGVSEFAVTIRSDGNEMARQTLRFALPGYFGLSEVFGVGADDGSPVMAGYHPGTPFPGSISDVEFTILNSTMPGAH
jgi:arylsulfatase